MAYLISEINQMSQMAFVEVFGGVFEHTPEIALQVWTKRPFVDVEDLHRQMVAIINDMSTEKQLRLICAHPELGSKVKMAEASINEQAGVGLDKMNAAEYESFQIFNQSYKDKFGFPFIVAVKNHTKTSILELFESRLQNT
ncbi:MAG: 2-oxo-4-hydroxy-4-carboxy-5-ureidoimidazoline decarboxylase, partial [Coleofasciculaceae cyanobacterium]